MYIPGRTYLFSLPTVGKHGKPVLLLPYLSNVFKIVHEIETNFVHSFSELVLKYEILIRSFSDCKFFKFTRTDCVKRTSPKTGATVILLQNYFQLRFSIPVGGLKQVFFLFSAQGIFFLHVGGDVIEIIIEVFRQLRRSSQKEKRSPR